jgi:hypothetical protein
MRPLPRGWWKGSQKRWYLLRGRGFHFIPQHTNTCPPSRCSKLVRVLGCFTLRVPGPDHACVEFGDWRMRSRSRRGRNHRRIPARQSSRLDLTSTRPGEEQRGIRSPIQHPALRSANSGCARAASGALVKVCKGLRQERYECFSVTQPSPAQGHARSHRKNDCGDGGPR